MEGRLCEMERSTWPVTNTAIVPNAGKENKGVFKRTDRRYLGELDLRVVRIQWPGKSQSKERRADTVQICKYCVL